MLSDLQLIAEFIYEQPASGDIEYIFKHALTQEVSYNSLLNERRKLLHERTAAALEAIFSNQLDDHLDELAHHYSRSGNLDKAMVGDLTRAGQQALNRSAFTEALSQLQQGLEWIKTLPESPERDARELELASSLTQVLIVTRGYDTSRPAQLLSGLAILAEKSRQPGSTRCTGIRNLAQPFLRRRLHSTAGVQADRISRSRPAVEGSPASFGFVCGAQVNVRFFRGDFAGAEEHFARLSGFLDADGFKQVPGAAVGAIGAAFFCAWISGRV